MENKELKNPTDCLQLSDVLINSKYKNPGVTENRILLLGLYYLQKGKYTSSVSNKNIIVQIPTLDIRLRLGYAGKPLNIRFKDIYDKLTNFKVLYTNPDNNKTSLVNLCVKALSINNGTLNIVFNGSLKDYLIPNPSRTFTAFNLSLLLGLKKYQSVRLYALLMSEAEKFKDSGYNCSFKINLAELKFILGSYDPNRKLIRDILDKKDLDPTDYEAAELAIKDADTKGKALSKEYLPWYKFKKSILNSAIEEINATSSTNMVIDEVVADPKKDSTVEFKYKILTRADKTCNDTTDSTISDDEKMRFIYELRDTNLNCHFSPQELKKIANESNWDMSACQKYIKALGQNQNL